MSSNSRTNLAADGLVHDLNNVFQTILQAACLISCDDHHSGNAEIITRCVERARRILGMGESGDLSPLLDIVKRAAGFVHDYLNTNGGPALSVIANLNPTLRVARSTAMERVLINLILNAAQAGARAQRTSVEVRVDGRVEQGAFVFTVADDGPGLPEACGTGLGLSIVEQFVQDCSGTLTAANSESGGAVFTIRFPTAFVTAAESPPPNAVLAERVPR